MSTVQIYSLAWWMFHIASWMSFGSQSIIECKVYDLSQSNFAKSLWGQFCKFAFILFCNLCVTVYFYECHDKNVPIVWVYALNPDKSQTKRILYMYFLLFLQENMLWVLIRSASAALLMNTHNVCLRREIRNNKQTNKKKTKKKNKTKKNNNKKNKKKTNKQKTNKQTKKKKKKKKKQQQKQNKTNKKQQQKTNKQTNKTKQTTITVYLLLSIAMKCIVDSWLEQKRFFRLVAMWMIDPVTHIHTLLWLQ